MKTIAAFSFSLTLLLVPAVQAFNPQPEPPGFGMIGMVSSQAARLNGSLRRNPIGVAFLPAHAAESCSFGS